MIPHRMLNSEIWGSGLKDRVTACRKRLRVKRVAQRAEANKHTGELFGETTPAVSSSHHHAADIAIMGSVVRMDYRSTRAEVKRDESETSLLVGEQEVGIT